MASIFEEMMTANHDLTESTKKTSSRNTLFKRESRKISCNKLKVESRKFFEENDITDLEKDFEIPEESQDEVVLVIDPEIRDDEEVPEDAAEELVGDLVYKCPICGSNYVCDCDAEGVVEGVEVDENGAPLECPICGDDADQILVGEIAPAEEAPGEETELPPQSPEDEEIPEIDDEEINGEIPEDEPLEDSLSRSQTQRTVKEDLDSLDDEGSEVDEPVLDLDTNSAEEPIVEIKDSDVNLYFDETKLEALMCGIMKENYKGTPQFKVTKIKSSQNSLKIEYVVRNKGKSVKGTLVGEGFNRNSRAMKLSFRDKGAFTESFAKKPSFTVECVRVRRTITPLSVKYDYKTKVNESLYRVKGSVDFQES